MEYGSSQTTVAEYHQQEAGFGCSAKPNSRHSDDPFRWDCRLILL